MSQTVIAKKSLLNIIKTTAITIKKHQKFSFSDEDFIKGKVQLKHKSTENNLFHLPLYNKINLIDC